ncbi:MAG: DUF5711 family protein [Oscillospiraceae bacterium]|nr:DUF5711 family protein [Oscillospiraceae bacterium]
MPVTDISELRKRRQAKQTKNMIIKVFIILLICGAALIAALTKDMWLPYFKGILTTIPENLSSEGTAEMSEGKFPLKVEGGSGFQLMDMDGSLALLDESRFHVYSTDGKVMNERQHTFANPILCVSGSKALIYDEGGRDFSLESKYKNIYSKTADDVIYLAKLSKSDYAAVVTKSDKYLAMLKIYDPMGNPIFTYFSYDSRIINVTFTDNSSGCIVTVLSAEGGQLISRMKRFDFNDTEPMWESDGVATLALDVEFTDDGIIMIGDTASAGFTGDGVLVSQYVYSDPITDYSTSGQISAVITENTDIRKTRLISFNGADCASPVVISLDEEAKKVSADNSQVYILNDSSIEIYSSDGILCGEILLEDDFDDFCKCAKYIFLLGYDSVNRISYSG